MCKIIPFPQKGETRKYTYEDYVELLNEISELEFDIELSEGYNEFYKEENPVELYEQTKIEIENNRIKLDELKQKIIEVEQNII